MGAGLAHEKNYRSNDFLFSTFYIPCSSVLLFLIPVLPCFVLPAMKKSGGGAATAAWTCQSAR
jgi:hypothetical protein